MIGFRLIKCILGFGSIDDICWFSENYYDIHDYKLDSGGDGTPTHLYEYKCWNCGKKYTI